MTTALLKVAAGGFALALGIGLAPNVLLDDAAITFRYADRLAAGEGFTYNDHEHVLGASNPLYTLLLALLHLIGLELETAARCVGVACLVLAALLAFDLAERLAGPAAGAVAGCALASEPHFREMVLTGLESGLAAVLGMAVVAALVRGRETWAGVLLGLAIWNKLDAGLLAVAVAAAVLVLQRRFPTRIAVVAALVVLPWTLFALAYFGSPVPHSLGAKAGAGGAAFDRGWVLGFLGDARRMLWVLAAVPAVLLVRRLPARHGVAVLCLGGWFGLHALAYSLLDLGDEFPWYLTVLLPPLIVLGVASAFRVAAMAGRRAGLAMQLLAAIAVAGALAPVLRAERDELRAGNPVTPFEAFDNDRRLAGAFVARYADPREVVATPFGWPAYEVPNPVNDLVRLNSERMLYPATYLITHGRRYDAGFHPPRAPPGAVALATFNLASDLAPGYSWFTVFGRPSSRIARSGRRALQFRLFELPRPRTRSREAVAGARTEGLDLVSDGAGAARFTVRNERQPVRVAFTPGGRPGAGWELRAAGDALATGALAGGEPRREDVPVPGAARRDAVELSFVARAPMRWRRVKVMVGDAELDVERVSGSKLSELWRRLNP
jgi:hypothetical protein